MSTTSTPTRFATEFRAICGAGQVVEFPTENILGAVPSIAVTPGSPDEIVAILRFANEHRLNVVPAGGFTQQQTGDASPQIDVLLYTTRLTEVEHYDPGDLTIGVGAGWTISHLSAKVEADKLFFAGDPARPERATVGGLLATGLYGPLRHGYGGLRDYCIGVRFVTGDGRKGKGGGRVVKNVAGYDLMKLLIGSWGTLGIITSASFKLFPALRQTRTFVTEFAGAADAIAFRSRVLRSPLDPICLELISPEASAAIDPAFAQAGAGKNGSTSPAAPWSILLRAAGSGAVLARYRSELGTAISREIEGRDEQEAWRAVSDFQHLIAERRPRSLLASLMLPLADVQPVLDELATVAQSHGLTPAAIGRVGVGHLLAAMWPTTDAKAAPLNLLKAASGLRSVLPRDASMTVLQCPEDTRGEIGTWAVIPNDVKSMRAIKLALDPNDILNRGRFPF